MNTDTNIDSNLDKLAEAQWYYKQHFADNLQAWAHS